MSQTYNYYINGFKAWKESYILDKNRTINDYIRFMFDRTQSMFRYDGLPDSIPKRMLELMLQSNGNVFITEVEGELYAFTGGFGGEPNVYYEPTIYTIANPYLKFNKICKIDEDGILVRNDSMMQGLWPLHAKYAELLAENDITMRIAAINMRLLNIISASDDKTRNSGIEYLKQIEKGNLGVIAENAFLEGIKLKPTANVSNYLTQLAEFNQYLKASWYNELGIQANYNMKRETLNSAETQMNVDALIPLIDNMLEQRKIAFDKVNSKFNKNIKVELDSSWENTQEAAEAILDELTNPEEEEESTDDTEQQAKED